MTKSLLYRSLCLALAGGAALPASGQASVLAISSQYLAALQKLGTNCQMQYRASYRSGSQTVATEGVLAIKGENAYDSSSKRFYLKNETWVVHADHERKMIKVLYLPKWKEEMGPNVTVVGPAALFSQTDLSAVSGFEVKGQGKDSLKVSFRYVPQSGQQVDMQLYYPKGSFVPGRYAGTLTSTPPPNIMDGKPVAAPVVTLTFWCYNVQPQADNALFDDRRLIQVQGKTATLRRYNHYKTLRRTRD